MTPIPLRKHFNEKTLYGFGVVASHSRPHDIISNSSVVRALVVDDEAQVVHTPERDDIICDIEEPHVAYFAIESFFENPVWISRITITT